MDRKLCKYIVLFLCLQASVFCATGAWFSFISSEELNSAEILTLEQKDTSLYIGTSNGLFVHRGGETIQIPGLPGKSIEDIVFDKTGRPWCIIEGRVYVLSEGYWCECVMNWLDTLGGGKATSLEMGITDIIIGTNRGKIFQVDSREPTTRDTIVLIDSTSADTVIYTDSIVEIRPSNVFEANGRYFEGITTIYNVKHYKRGLYLISTSNGFFQYNSKTRLLTETVPFRTFLPSPYITFCSDVESDTVFWFAGTNEVFKVIEVAPDSIVILRDSIPNVRRMHLDSQERLWCSSDNKFFEISTNSLAFLEYNLPEELRNSVINDFVVINRQVFLAVGNEIKRFIPELPKLKVDIQTVKRRNKNYIVIFRVENAEYYPHLITRMSLDTSEWSGPHPYTQQITEDDTTYFISLGDLSIGNHDVRVRVRAPIGDESFVQDSHEFVVLPLIKWTLAVGVFKGILLIGIPAVVVIITLLIFGYRFWIKHRSERLLRAKQLLTKNPYIVGRPISIDDPQKFIGRQKILRDTLRGIYNNNIVIEGERRIGKTSVLHQIYRRLRARKSKGSIMIPVFVSLQQISTSRKRMSQKKAVINFYTHLVQEISKETNYVEETMGECGSGEFVSFIEKLGPFLKKNYRNKKIRVILLIDEADEMRSYGKDFHENFRGVFQTIRSMFINIVLALYDYSLEWKAITSPWFNFFIPKKLEPLSQPDTYNLAQGYVKDSLHYKRGALKTIWGYTTGNPHLVQWLCSEIYDNLGEKEVTIRRRLVKKAYRNIKKQIEELYNAG